MTASGCTEVATDETPTDKASTGAVPGDVRRGRLVVVGTPLGNLGDLSPRGREALASADVVACEDTRRTGRLYQLVGLKAPTMIVIEQHVERAGAARVLAAIDGGSTVVLVTDAGMPGISDPGGLVVDAVHTAGGRIEVVPGPSAVSAALAVSGLLTDRFVMEGFLPRSRGERGERIRMIAAETRAVVCFESPGRLARTLAEMAAVCADERRVVVCRELTKMHETIWRGTVVEAVERFGVEPVRGEIVLVVAAGPPPVPASEEELRAALVAQMATGATTRGAVDAVSRATGARRSAVYALAIGLAVGLEAEDDDPAFPSERG